MDKLQISFFTPESIEEEIKRLQSFKGEIERGSEGKCPCCGHGIRVHSIWTWFANMQPGDSIEIPLKYLPAGVIEVAFNHAKNDLSSNGISVDNFYAGFTVRTFGKIDRDFYTVSNYSIKNNLACVLRHFAMHKDGTIHLIRIEKESNVYTAPKLKPRSTFMQGLFSGLGLKS